FYALFGSAPIVAMLVNTLFGAACALSAYELAHASGWGRRASIASGMLVAIHPALVPYTLAIMTEGVTASLLMVAAALAAHHRQRKKNTTLVLLGIALGIATLVRPQSILLAPIFGWIASRGNVAVRARTAAIALVIAVACCLPWTARNCVRMHRCALVSVNAGWNLLIGESTETGAWHPVDVPGECKTVWDEAAKDTCFERAARHEIAQNPIDFVSRMPGKLAVTFDYFGGAPWYLHESNASAFSDRAKEELGIVETIFSRIVLAVALFGFAWLEKKNAKASAAIALAGFPFAFLRHGWIGYAALAVAILASKLARKNPALATTAWTLVATAVTHAVFFGAGRYGLVSSPFSVVVCASAGARMLRGNPRPSLSMESFKNSFKRS
ncbi:MAG: glycosyltransferase family 39 protein, partial [Polyangiaceae bacterium]